MTDLSAKPRVLFVSKVGDPFAQIAQVVVSQLAGSALESLTTGLAPIRVVSPQWMELLRSRGYRFTPQHPMPVEEIDQGVYDAVICMSSEDIVPWISGMIRENWALDEKPDSELQRNRLLNQIEDKLENLVSRICAFDNFGAAETGQQPKTS